MDWFWIIYGGGLGLAVVLFWISEFTNMRLGRNKSKSIWQQSKDRIYKQNYRATTHYSAGRTHNINRKGY